MAVIHTFIISQKRFLYDGWANNLFRVLSCSQRFSKVIPVPRQYAGWVFTTEFQLSDHLLYQTYPTGMIHLRFCRDIECFHPRTREHLAPTSPAVTSPVWSLTGCCLATPHMTLIQLQTILEINRISPPTSHRCEIIYVTCSLGNVVTYCLQGRWLLCLPLDSSAIRHGHILT